VPAFAPVRANQDGRLLSAGAANAVPRREQRGRRRRRQRRHDRHDHQHREDLEADHAGVESDLHHDQGASAPNTIGPSNAGNHLADHRRLTERRPPDPGERLQ
jgi:hypothetical protein